MLREQLDFSVIALVMFGYSKSATGLRIERYARNRDTSRAADNDGVVSNGPILADAPERRPTTSAARFVRRLRAEGVPANLSSNAGGFVCNHVLYKALATTPMLDAPAVVSFAHVPDWEQHPDRAAILKGAGLIVRWVTGTVS